MKEKNSHKKFKFDIINSPTFFDIKITLLAYTHWIYVSYTYYKLDKRTALKKYRFFLLLFEH